MFIPYTAASARFTGTQPPSTHHLKQPVISHKDLVPQVGPNLPLDLELYIPSARMTGFASTPSS